jgi:NADPH:quinone reductase-like Zn-dependent oxidoreductase
VIRRAVGKNVRLLVVPQDRELLAAATDLCAQGHVVPAIDERYPVSEARAAFRRISEGRQRGKIVILFEG